MSRRLWVLVHRYAGLFMALQLTVAGLGGAILAFDPWLYEWLNPDLSRVPVQDRPMLDPFALRERALALDPRIRINAVELNTEPGEVPTFFVEPRLDPATGKPFELGYLLLYLDPYSGREIAREQAGVLWPVTRRNFTQVVYALHTSLACGEIGGWLFGLAALVWVLDSFVSLYLTFPPRRGRTGGSAAPVASARASWWARWRPSWTFTWRGKPYPVNFNLHRAAGLWLWPLLLALAVSSVSFNLPQVYQPVMRTLFGMREEGTALPDLPQPMPDPALGWRHAAVVGERLMAEQARLHGFTVRPSPGTMFFSYDATKGIYAYPAHTDRDVGYHTPGAVVSFDGQTGAFRGISFASGHNAATTFTSWVAAIHGCTVGGLAMHGLVCLAGLVTATLSITGVYLWLKKRRFASRAALCRARPV